MDYIKTDRWPFLHLRERRSATMRRRRPAAFSLIMFTALLPGLAGCPSDRPAQPGVAGLVPDNKPAPAIRWVDATVPQGTRLGLVMIDRVGSDASKRGDLFKSRLADAVVQGEMVVVPAGSTVFGVVAQVTSARTGFKNKGGSVVLAFSRISTPTGAGADLTARLVRVGGAGESEGTVAIVGTVDGGAEFVRLLGRDPNDPAQANAGVATAVAAGSRGRDAILAAETPIEIVLERPLQIKVHQ